MAEAPEAGRGRRRALLIATSRYGEATLQDLPAAKTDLVNMSAVLGLDGVGRFDVTPLLNQPITQVRRQIERVFTAEAHPDDFLVLYLSGHGKVDGPNLWFCLADYSKDNHRATGLEARWIRELLEASRARQQLIVIDTCYSGLFVAKGSETLPDIDIHDAQDALPAQGDLPPGEFQYFILASGNSEEAYFERQDKRTDKGSRLTDLMVSALRSGRADVNGDGLVGLDELWSVIERESSSWEDQRPARHIARGGGLSGAAIAYTPWTATATAVPTAARPIKRRWLGARRSARRKIIYQRYRRLIRTAAAAAALFLVTGLTIFILTRPVPPRTIAIRDQTWRQVNTDGTASFTVVDQAISQLAVPSGHLVWYGYYFPFTSTCDYTFSVRARHIENKKPVNGGGWGFGISVRSSWDEQRHSGDGLSLQDEFSYQENKLYGDLRLTSLSDPNSAPYPAFVVLPDYDWHSYVFIANGNQIVIKRDAEQIGTYPAPSECGGVFIRVWSETAQFRDATLRTGPNR